MSSTGKKPSARKRTTSSTTARTATTTTKASPVAPRVRVTRAAKPATAKPGPTQQDIERRAYELYLRDGRHGNALEHWLQAERELRRV